MRKGRLRSRKVALGSLVVAALGLPARAPAVADPARTFATEIGCGKSALGPALCHRLFAAARAEYVSRTRAYPSRFACYRAFGPCMPWPAGSLDAFRPQWMGVAVSGTGEAATALPVVAGGHIALGLVPRAPGDVAVAAALPPDAGHGPWAGRRAPDGLCRQIEAVAVQAHLPPAFLARLLWQESSFRADVVSPAGARGIAQFMPATAAERGLADPFDAARAIETSAGLLGDLARRFGNLGLAAAAYNGGPARVAGWLKGQRTLAAETQDYVQRITGQPVEAWAAPAGGSAAPALGGPCRFGSPAP